LTWSARSFHGSKVEDLAEIPSVCQTDFAGFRDMGGSMSVILSDLLLFCCLAAFYTGIVLAAASLAAMQENSNNS
jgi:hypothetical protein